jgi:hypothetical protein
MKSILHKNILFRLILLTGLLLGCGSDPELTQVEKKTAIMTKSTWKLKDVLVDGIDQTDVYEGLTLKFTETAFTTTNGGLVWPAAGTWNFKDDVGTTINRSDGIEIELTEISDAKLVLKLSWDKSTIGPGRIGSLSGAHKFTFGI